MNTCECCGLEKEDITRRGSIQNNVGYYCLDCYLEKFRVCHECDELLSTEEEVFYGKDGEEYCQECHIIFGQRKKLI